MPRGAHRNVQLGAACCADRSEGLSNRNDRVEAGLAQTVEGLFGLDLAGLDAWTESQKTDLRTCLSYMREVLRNKAMLTTSLTTGKQRRAVPKGRGFGGGGAGKAKGKAKGPKNKKRKR